MEDTTHFIGFVAIEVARASDCRVVGSAERVAADINRLKLCITAGILRDAAFEGFLPEISRKVGNGAT